MCGSGAPPPLPSSGGNPDRSNHRTDRCSSTASRWWPGGSPCSRSATPRPRSARTLASRTAHMVMPLTLRPCGSAMSNEPAMVTPSEFPAGAPKKPISRGMGRLGFVIFASPKSGTEWVQELLRAHPEVMCAESRVFGDYVDPDHVSGMNITLESYVSILSNYHRAPDDASDYFRGLLFDLIDAIAGRSLDVSGKTIYGEKITPLPGTASRNVDRLAEYDTGLKFVHLARDGRDVIVSGLAHQAIIHGRAGTPRGRTLRQAVADQRVPHDMLEFFTDLWIEATAAAIDARGRFEHQLVLRYEDLLDDTVGSTRRLLEFIDVDPRHADRCADAATFERMSGGRRRGEEDRSSVARKGVAGDWRHWLTDDQAAWFDHRAGDLMERMGYGRVGAAA